MSVTPQPSVLPAGKTGLTSPRRHAHGNSNSGKKAIVPLELDPQIPDRKTSRSPRIDTQDKRVAAHFPREPVDPLKAVASRTGVVSPPREGPASPQKSSPGGSPTRISCNRVDNAVMHDYNFVQQSDINTMQQAMRVSNGHVLYVMDTLAEFFQSRPYQVPHSRGDSLQSTPLA